MPFWSSSASSEDEAAIRSTLVFGGRSSLMAENCWTASGSVGVKALKPWMFSLSGNVIRIMITFGPLALTSTLGRGNALVLSPPPGLNMMFMSMFRLWNRWTFVLSSCLGVAELSWTPLTSSLMGVACDGEEGGGASLGTLLSSGRSDVKNTGTIVEPRGASDSVAVS